MLPPSRPQTFENQRNIIHNVEEVEESELKLCVYALIFWTIVCVSIYLVCESYGIK